MRTHFNVIDGAVVLTFDSEITWLKMTPEEALAFAKALNDCAQRAKSTPLTQKAQSV
jgi:hypothetical protein